MSRRAELVESSSRNGNSGGQSLVEYHDVQRSICGYCKSTSRSSIAHGLSAYNLRVDDYQDLLDCGWRRSGTFLYKPEMESTCCPLYTIRLKVEAFVPTKEQKRVQRRIQRYMDGTNDGLRTVEYRQKENNIKCRKSSSSITSIFETTEMPQVSASSKVSANTVNSKTPEVDSTAKSISSKIDVALKACVESGDKDFDGNKNFQHHEKHKLEIRMKRSTFDPEEFALYKKYQIRVHNDRPEEVRESSYKTFLVETPLIFVPPGNDSAPPCGFGSFHQQYLIDGRLVAVGVVDILPRCLSSKYMFWDPDLAFLSLGKYSALEEIKWVQAAQKHCPTLQYYYLGYYIHSCPKMRYKAAYNPSELLCAVHYQWTPFQLAKLVLDKAAYLCLCDVCDHAEPILTPATDEMHDSYGQDDHEMEDNLEFCDGELHEFQSSGSSDHSMGVENGVEAPTVDFYTEDIGGVLIQRNGLWFRFKDLKASGIMGRQLTGRLQKYIKVVGTELSERIAYCLD